jgi:hypothetical protein
VELAGGGGTGSRSERSNTMYSVFVQLCDGEFLFIASREDLEEAVKLVEALGAQWPHEYVVRDSEGNDVDLE